MIENTFQHIPGFTALKEQELWKQKIFTWSDYEKRQNIQMSLSFDDHISLFDESIYKLQLQEADFFAKNLHPHFYYRIAHSFPEQTLFIDIETTGLSRYYDRVTVVGWSIMDKYKIYIDGDEEAKQDLKNDLENCSCIITFNGSLFDLPFIKMLIPGIEIPVCHIDLRFFCRRAGLQGGQKIIENLLGFERPKELKEVDGFEATILWHKYKEGDIDSLKKLILYNAHDINGMKYIFEKITESILVKEKASIPISKIFPFTEYYSSVEFCIDRKYDNKVFVKPYTGKNGPVIFLDDLPDLSSHKVVGIDLTGSEKKPTGWAVLDDGIALTKTISTDEELIEETIRLNPSIISIDSPLSIPFGRTTVFDDDPYRKEFGITRECERIMAKRGVKSYPCLIQSMQKLTQRGMKLAAEFRKRGFKVIESYPGAAQDILGIPRKGKSLEYLIKGLYAFGIKGDFNDPKVTHDEIDAITSALVGYFFLANMYEALGNENEDYLIIPSLRNATQK